MTLSSTSPRAAATISPNLLTTPPRRPRRLFSARVSRKFLTVGVAPPACLASSATMAALSSALSVGASRMAPSLGSLSRRLPRLARALAVGSRADDLAAAVYCGKVKC